MRPKSSFSPYESYIHYFTNTFPSSEKLSIIRSRQFEVDNHATNCMGPDPVSHEKNLKSRNIDFRHILVI